MMSEQTKLTNTRRRFLQLCTGAAAGLMIPTVNAAVTKTPVRTLSFYNTHTDETLTAPYWENGEYIENSLTEINHILRDYRNGEIFPIEPRLMDMLYLLQHKIRKHTPFHIISGYRSPETNRMLRQHSRGVAKRSLHMMGKAIDIRLPGYDLKHLHQAAKALRIGGVGYYPRSNFIHVDVGRVRYWAG